MTHLERLRDESGFIHRSAIGRFVGGVASSIVSTVPVVGGIASGLITQFTGGGETIPQATGCPPGFIRTAAGCAPTGTIAMERRGGFLGRSRRRQASDLRQQIGIRGTRGVPGSGTVNGGPGPQVAPMPLTTFAAGAPASVNGVPRPEIPTLAVTGQFGAGFEASIVSREMRLCPPKTVLGVDGVCYNRRDLRNDERAWPRGRRPLLTGGEMRAVSTASAAAKKLQRKQKQLQELGLLPKPQRARRALLPGHRATLTHAGATGHE